MYKRIYNTFNTGRLAILLVAGCIGSCKKTVIVDAPVDKLTAAAVFQNDQSATAAVNGIYSQMMPVSLFYSCGGTSIFTGMAADELYNTSTVNPNESQFAENAIDPGNSIIQTNFWYWTYKMTYQANTCIERLNASASLSPEVKNKLMGEVLFIRAFNYFYLVNLFGAVPLVTGTDYKWNAVRPRSSISEVYDRIIQDLLAAKEILPGNTAPITARPGKWAATALLARVYLYLQQWDKAAETSSLLINSGAYQLENNLDNVFLLESKEAIWQLLPVETGFNTTIARYLVPTTAATNKPAFALMPQLFTSFSSTDKRKAAWIKAKNVSNINYYYSYKYKVRNLNLPVTEGYTVLRLAEIYLLRAEALAQQGKLAEAKEDINKIKARAGIPLTVANTRDELLLDISNERRKELFAEWGHRWLDLKRNGTAISILSNVKIIQPHALLWPIPIAEILRNPALTQNPGY